MLATMNRLLTSRVPGFEDSRASALEASAAHKHLTTPASA